MQSYIDLQAAPEAKALEIKEPSRPRLVEEMTTLGMVRTPKLARWFAATLILIFVVSPFLLIWLPWQQSLHGNGRLIAFDPTERQQEMEAPIDGRILKWYVQEGQRVKGPQFSPDGKMLRPGDLMVSIQDPDPELPRRLGQQREAVQERIQAARQRIDSFNKQITALQRSRERALLAARNRLAMAEERLKAAGEAVTVARLQSDLALTNFRMENQLVNEGLTSQLTYITAKQRRDQTLADERRAANTMEASRSEVSAMKADVDKIGNDADASISSAMASKQSAEAELASGNRDLADIETRISRQTTQEVTAPCDGTVYRILANADQGGALVKAGERLAIVTPDILDPNHRTVELFLSGNDAPQLMELWRQRLRDGQESPISVRLQFEGWPALQIIGWPSIAWGTFAGTVSMVDPHDDGKGRFRILVQQDPDGEPWPSNFSLRQGTRAQGWVLLDRVSIGYELWRRFNGFSPVVADKDKDEEEPLKKKPAKAKVPK